MKSREAIQSISRAWDGKFPARRLINMAVLEGSGRSL
jgi:hypothetical protein